MTNNIYNNEKSGKNWDGSQRTCGDSGASVCQNYTFSAATINQTKLITQIVNKAFKLDISVSCDDDGGLEDKKGLRGTEKGEIELYSNFGFMHVT